MKKTRQSDLGSGIPADPIFHYPQDIQTFQKLVLDHYRESGRDLPWRRTTDPYCILVSEIMLQQTQVDRVAVKYPAFIETFPDVASLAAAPLKEVLAVWQGMGYNRRAIALQKCAQLVITRFDGSLPASIDTLATFPGIGRATASSICAFAFNMPVIFIETNIRRVYIHFFFSDTAVVSDTEILPVLTDTLFREDPRTFYNALMDLGTSLKKTVPNPNRRSLHYTKQSAFEGSDREIRGWILKSLLSGKKITEEVIVSHFPEEPPRIRKIIAALKAEGFIGWDENRLVLTS
jgi:A/G-specific adenine glycosylase